MILPQRYIFRLGLIAFLAAAIALTAVIWMTQALRELDLLTTKGQSLLIFLAVTALALPSLIMLIAPFALFGASLYALNRLNGDSELVVMASAGLSPTQLLRPFLALALVVGMLIGTISLYVLPLTQREIRDLLTRIRADFISRVVREGTFTTLDAGFTFHYRDRGPASELRGVFMQDRRAPERVLTYLAETGQTVEIDGGNYLVLEKGSVQSQQQSARDAAIVVFDRYAIDLSQFSKQGEEVYRPRDRSTLELLQLSADDPRVLAAPGRFRSELHERLVNPLYPFMAVLIAFAALGQARTTRQSRGDAIFGATLIFALLRLAGIGALSMVTRSPWGLLALYGLPVLSSLVALVLILRSSRTLGGGGLFALRWPRRARLAGTQP
jgi:lipopolysaccharide export system permease protein